MPAVTIDMHGRFDFVLLRAADASGMHKLLVRGKNGSTQGQLLQVGLSLSTFVSCFMFHLSHHLSHLSSIDTADTAPGACLVPCSRGACS